MQVGGVTKPVCLIRLLERPSNAPPSRSEDEPVQLCMRRAVGRDHGVVDFARPKEPDASVRLDQPDFVGAGIAIEGALLGQFLHGV